MHAPAQAEQAHRQADQKVWDICPILNYNENLSIINILRLVNTFNFLLIFCAIEFRL